MIRMIGDASGTTVASITAGPNSSERIAQVLIANVYLTRCLVEQLRREDEAVVAALSER